MSVTSRPYANPADLRSLQALAEEASALRGPLAHRHVGGLAWDRLQHVGREAEWPTRIWEEDGRVVAWAWLRLPAELEFLVHPERPELLDEVLDWFEESVPGGELAVWAVAEDRAATSALAARGFRPADEAPWMALLTRGLGDVPDPFVPSGYSLRSVSGEEDLGAPRGRPPRRVPSVAGDGR